MSIQSDWYRDEDQLLGALKESRRPAKRKPNIHGYDELGELRRGGQGIVYSAIQRSTKRKVAIKVLLEGAWASDSRRHRFEREIGLIATLHHPNIVRLYDSGATDTGYPYYVMEYIEGTGLDELIGGDAQGRDWAQTHRGAALDVRPPAPRTQPSPPLSVRASLELFAKVSEAVSYAHQRGVIHRDLKPSNIRIDPDGEPYVLDFGLAKMATDLFAGAGDSPMSHTGEFVGSPPWASPEQADGDPHGTDVRSDVYALGIMLFQLLTRKFPYPVVGSLREVLNNIQNVEPLRPSTLRRELNDEIDTIVLKCLAKEPDRRYQSAGELARDVRHYLASEPIDAKRDSALYTLRKTMRRYEYAARAASIILLLSLGAAVIMSFLWLRAKEAEQLADQRLDAAEKSRAAAVVAEAETEKEATRARAINRFLINMLTSPLDLGREARVADVLDKAAAEIEQAKALDPATEAALREAIGNAYASLGLYEEADPQFQRTLELWKDLQGSDGPGTLQGLACIAWLRRQTGQLDESEALFRQLLIDRCRVLGEGHINTTRTMNDLANVLKTQGRLDEAEELHRKALANVRRLLGDEALDSLTSMGNLASVLCVQGRFEEAGALMRERLDTARRVLGENHRATLRAMGSYARLLDLVGDYEEAIRLSREVLEADRRILGEDHPETIVAQADLAIACFSAGKLNEAEALLRETLSHSRRVLGPEHPDTLAAISSLASVLNTRGQYEEGESLLREALHTSRDVSGEDHIDTLCAMSDLAHCLQVQDKRDQAASLYRTALAGCLRNLGDENPCTLTVMLDLGAALVEAGRYDQAEPLIRRVLSTRQRLLGEEHIDTVHAKLQLAILLHGRGSFEQARSLLAPLLKPVHGLMPPEHWYPAVVEGWYGQTLMGLERYAEAENHVLAAYQRLQTTLGSQHPRTRKLLKRVVELYETWNKPEQAEHYRAQLPG